jgi:hypothetical protein
MAILIMNGNQNSEECGGMAGANIPGTGVKYEQASLHIRDVAALHNGRCIDAMPDIQVVSKESQTPFSRPHSLSIHPCSPRHLSVRSATNKATP